MKYRYLEEVFIDDAEIDDELNEEERILEWRQKIASPYY